MVENHVEELRVAGRAYRFELCRKAGQMGPVRVDHWWMDARRLYGQRNRAGATGLVLAEYFRALCVHHGTADDPEVQESYILARLLPYARSTAGRKVFADARPGPPRTPKGKEDSVQELERLVGGSRGAASGVVEFNRAIAEILGPPPMDPEVQELYREFTEELFGEARAALAADGVAGVAVAVARWEKAVGAWGRRAGLAVQKQVLDVLSYECRAALHRCYSAAWFELLPHLAAAYGLDTPSLDFLRHWHLEYIAEPEQDVPAYFHLFHGHIFGLHPIGGELIRTTVGRELVGEWLAGPDREAAFGRLLHAYSIAAHAYKLRLGASAEDRARRPGAIGDSAAVADRERRLVDRRGRRRSGRRKGDAR